MSNQEVEMLTEVGIPGFEAFGAPSDNYTSVPVCTKCGKKKSDCKCNNK